MLPMVSYSRRPQSGQITCYLNRTYHVLLTLQFPLDDDLPANRQNARQVGTIDGAEVNEAEGVAGELGGVASQDALCKCVVEARRLHSPQLPRFQAFILVQEVADRFDLRGDGGEFCHRLGCCQSHQSPRFGTGQALFNQIVLKVRLPGRGRLPKANGDGTGVGGSETDGTTRRSLRSFLRCMLRSHDSLLLPSFYRIQGFARTIKRSLRSRQALDGGSGSLSYSQQHARATNR